MKVKRLSLMIISLGYVVLFFFSEVLINKNYGDSRITEYELYK